MKANSTISFSCSADSPLLLALGTIWKYKHKSLGADTPNGNSAKKEHHHIFPNVRTKFLFFILFIPALSLAQPSLLKDINPTGDSSPSLFFSLNGKVIFTANDGVHGFELWITDGTTSGTQLVKDINPGSASSIISNGAFPRGSFQVIGNILYFTAANANSGIELWKTDGTDLGTTMVKDISPGTSDGIPLSVGSYNSYNFIEFNGQLYFTAKEGTGTSPNRLVLWKSDGSSGGTVPVFSGPSIQNPAWLVKNSNAIFFAADYYNTAYSGTELFKWDATNGASLVKKINSGNNSSGVNRLFAGDAGKIYFPANNSGGATTLSDKLWMTDGSNAGTVLVQDMAGKMPIPVANSNGILYFSTGQDIWRSDGTASGIFKLGDTPYFLEQPSSITQSSFIAYNNRFYYNYPVNNPRKVIQTDGSIAGTQDFFKGTSIFGTYASNFKIQNNKLYFIDDLKVIWESDGTPVGTSQVAGGITKNIGDYLFLGSNLLIGTDEIYFSVGKTNQTITFNPLPAKTYGNAPFALTATTSSGLPVTYVSSNNAIASISGNIVTITGVGTCTITAKQAGDATFYAAPDVQQTLTVTLAPPSSTPATNITTSGFTANWNALPGATGYQLDISKDNFATFIAGYNSKILTATSELVTGLDASTTYYYQVRATNASGVSPNSNVVQVFTLTLTICTGGVADGALAAPSSSYQTASFASAGLYKTFTAVQGTLYNFSFCSNGGSANYDTEISIIDNTGTATANGYNDDYCGAQSDLTWQAPANGTYRVLVTAYNCNAAGGTPATLAYATLSPLNPPAPVATIAYPISPSGFTANWNAVSGATGYRLDVSTDNFTTFIAGFNNKTVTTLSDAVSGLSASTGYSFRVRAVNANGTSISSNVIYVTTGVVGTAPVIPVAVAATGILSTGFTANWNAVSGATGYRLDISADNFVTFVSGYNSRSVTATTRIVTGLTANTAYKYRVRATNASGTSANSNVIDVTTLVPAPIAPAAIAATAISSTGFTANWNTVTDATGYQLDISADNFATFITGYNSKALTAITEVVSGLTANTAYKYRVRATNASGTSASSNTIDVTTLAKQDQTITFAALADKTLGDAAFALTATASSTLPVAYSTTSDKITISGSQVTLVKAGRASIVANQAGNDSFNSATAVTQSFCIKPAKPTITITNTNTETVTLTSSASAGNQWYLAGTSIAGATNATLAVTAPGVYKVQVKVDDCMSVVSDGFSIVVTGDISASSSIVLYPNPTKDYIFITGIKESVTESAVIDAVGRSTAIKIEKQNDILIGDVSNLSGGIYILKISESTGVHFIKFFKQ